LGRYGLDSSGSAYGPVAENLTSCVTINFSRRNLLHIVVVVVVVGWFRDSIVT